MRLLRAHLIGFALLAGCCVVQVPPAQGQCVGTTCIPQSLTTYIPLCQLNSSCNRQDFIDNLNENWRKLDRKFAPTVVAEGHGHRGTNGDGPKLSADSALNCSNSPSDGECLAWAVSDGQCVWTACGSGGGGGTGDVTGPASSVDRRLAFYNGTTGKIIQDTDALTGWTIDIDRNLIGSGTLNVAIGVNDASPDALLDVDNNNSAVVPAIGARCAGARTAHSTCTTIAALETSSTASQTKIAQNIFVSGTWNGANSRAIGTFYDTDVGATNPYAIWVQTGQVYMQDRVGIGSDSTPDAALEIVDDQDNLNTLSVSKAFLGTNNPTQTAIFTNGTTGGDGTFTFKSALQLSSSGAWNGLNIALVINATGGVQGNVAVGALSGDIFVAAGNIQVQQGTVFVTTSTANTRTGDLTCSGSPAAPSCLRVTASGVSADDGMEVFVTGTDPFGIDVEVTGSGSGGATGFEVDVTNTGAEATAFRAAVTGTDGTVVDLVANGAAGGDIEGVSIAVDGNGNDTSTGMAISVTDTLGGAALTAAFSGATTTASTGAAIFTNTRTSSTNSINKVGVQVNSTGTWNGTSAINGAVQASATGGTRNFAFWALQGGILTDSSTYNPLIPEPLACNATNEGTQAYDADINTMCVCSDSDGSSFEWEAIGLPLVDCFT